MIGLVLGRLLERSDLSFEEARAAVDLIADGAVSPVLIAALLTALRSKGETPDEIAGFADALRSRALPVRVRAPVFVDLCGTGGDGQGTFNISTAASFVVAGCGVPVAKHGNRAVSSRAGSADVLQALGAQIDLPAIAVERCLAESGIGFLFAPSFNPAFRAVAAVRRELGVRTVFNLLGPLVSPARPRHQVVGVFAPGIVRVVAGALSRLGVVRGLVVHGDGIDEIAVSGATVACSIEDGKLREFTFTPADLGLATHDRGALAGGDAEHNARLLRAVLGGERGAHRDAVVATAAAGLFVAGAAESLREGARRAEDCLDRGAAQHRLDAFLRCTQRAA